MQLCASIHKGGVAMVVCLVHSGTSREQQAHTRNVSPSTCVHERGAPVVSGLIHACARVEEDARAMHVATQARVSKGGRSQGAFVSRVSAAVNQKLSTSCVTFCTSLHKCSVAEKVAAIHVCPALKHELCAANMALRAHIHEHCAPVVHALVDVSTTVQQKSYTCTMPTHARELECGDAEPSFAADSCAIVEQQTCTHFVAYCTGLH
mmetsp:Transcript_14128/g.41561  ORF Transcript_14128/g.41561 Transcript_14128/m.41561 type:complete len:207 (-) Transcript_14128:343-963(-)